MWKLLDRINKINRIVGVRVESWSSRKEVGTIPLSRLRQGYGGQANSFSMENRRDRRKTGDAQAPPKADLNSPVSPALPA